MNQQIEITFYSDWHIASSVGGGILADSMLVRDGMGIPYIPGRALKGALREAATLLGNCRDDLRECAAYYFGTGSMYSEAKSPGVLSVSRGELPADMYSLLSTYDRVAREAYVRDMTIIRKQTALEHTGVVKEHSLRSIECGIPGIRYTATIQCDSDAGEEWDRQYLVAVCAAVKSIGAGKSRGLGRCTVMPVNQKGAVTLPDVWPLAQGGDYV